MKCPRCNSTRYKPSRNIDKNKNILLKGMKCFKCGYVNYRRYEIKGDDN